MKPIQPRWMLQTLVEMEVAKIAPEEQLIPCVLALAEDAIVDEESDGLARASWACEFSAPNGPPPLAVMNQINAAIARWQKQFDLGVPA